MLILQSPHCLHSLQEPWQTGHGLERLSNAPRRYLSWRRYFYSGFPDRPYPLSPLILLFVHRHHGQPPRSNRSTTGSHPIAIVATVAPRAALRRPHCINTLSYIWKFVLCVNPLFNNSPLYMEIRVLLEPAFLVSKYVRLGLNWENICPCSIAPTWAVRKKSTNGGRRETAP